MSRFSPFITVVQAWRTNRRSLQIIGVCMCVYCWCDWDSFFQFHPMFTDAFDAALPFIFCFIPCKWNGVLVDKRQCICLILIEMRLIFVNGNEKKKKTSTIFIFNVCILLDFLQTNGSYYLRFRVNCILLSKYLKTVCRQHLHGSLKTIWSYYKWRNEKKEMLYFSEMYLNIQNEISH